MPQPSPSLESANHFYFRFYIDYRLLIFTYYLKAQKCERLNLRQLSALVSSDYPFRSVPPFSEFATSGSGHQWKRQWSWRQTTMVGPSPCTKSDRRCWIGSSALGPTLWSSTKASHVETTVEQHMNSFLNRFILLQGHGACWLSQCLERAQVLW